MNAKLYSFIFIVFFLFTIRGLAQNGRYSDVRLWKLTNVNGMVGLRGLYAEQENILNNEEIDLKIPNLFAGMSIYTQSFILRPEIFKLDISGEFNPGYTNRISSVNPSVYQTFTSRKFETRAILLSEKEMSVTGKYSRGRSIVNRDNLSSQIMEEDNWGLNYRFNNKFLPITASYDDRDLFINEIETNRIWTEERKDFNLLSKRSFTKNGDRNEIRYNLHKFNRNTVGFDQNRNDRENTYLKNFYFLDSDKKYSLTSNITNIKQTGNLYQNTLRVMEHGRFKLNEQLLFSAYYHYIQYDLLVQNYDQHRIGGRLNHTLYSSLTTSVNYDRSVEYHSNYEQKNKSNGVSFKYRKKIPKGVLNLSYSFNVIRQERQSNSGSVDIITNEAHALTDGQIVLLNNPSVDIASVVVKDEFGSTIYQIDFDYFLIARENGFIEIRRIPGGQIPNEGNILVDYKAKQIGSYKFNSNTARFNAKIIMFKRLIEVYYTSNKLYYNDIQTEFPIPINYFDQYIFGGKIQIGTFTAGAESDRYKSSIVPYNRMRYYFRVNRSIRNRIILSLNGDLTNQTVTNDLAEQLFAGLGGHVSYVFQNNSRIDLNIDYRKQQGEGINLDMFRGRLEFSHMIRNMMIKAGFQGYKRLFYGESTRFNGIYFQIDRRF